MYILELICKFVMTKLSEQSLLDRELVYFKVNLFYKGGQTVPP